MKLVISDRERMTRCCPFAFTQIPQKICETLLKPQKLFCNQWRKYKIVTLYHSSPYKCLTSIKQKLFQYSL